VSAKFCPTCGGPLERIFSANICTAPKVHAVEALVAAGPQKPAVSAAYRRDVAAVTAAQQAGRRMQITPAAAMALGKRQGNPLFTGNSTMPMPKDQTPNLNPAGIPLPRVRPAGNSLVDMDTMRRRAGR